MTVLLALDSSTESMALALSSPQGSWFFEDVGGAKASERLVPELLALLGRAGLQLAEVDAIGFGQGPGAFTGLRTACAVAQGLAFGAGKPVLALDSLLLVAEDARQQALAAGETAPDSIWVAMDARMGEIYAAGYTHLGGQWRVESAPALYTQEALLARWQAAAPAALCGSALREFAALQGLALRAWPQTRSRAAALGILTEAAWAQGLQRDAAEAQPLYVRDKVALTTEERLAARAVPAS